MNTEQDHLDLYDEIKPMLFTRGVRPPGLTSAQTHFLNALENAAFGASFLGLYAELVNKSPTISVRDLHAFCLGFGLGVSDNLPEIELSKLQH